MQLHQLRPAYRSGNKKRIGRGGKRGTYSGRGQKGQRARAGHRIRPAQRDLIQRLPKLRGFKFKSAKQKPVIININDLAEKVKNNIINRKALVEAGLIKKTDKKVKILGKGKITQPLTIQGIKVSGSVKKEIIAAGGSVS